MTTAAASGDPPQVDDGHGHRVILVREQDAQHSGSGCCGRLGEAHTQLGEAADFSHNRELMERVGAIYRRLRAERPGLAIDVVDPRNTLWLYPAVWRAAGRAGQSLGARLRQLARVGSAVSVVLDGEVLYAGELPAIETVIATIDQRLGQTCVR